MSRYAATFVSPNGPGDARPTALQVVEDEGLLGKLAGKTALVTGANQGIGLETARALHATGATVFITVRDAAKGKAAVESITTGDKSSGAPVHVLEMELDSLKSVRAAAAAFIAQSSTLNILVNNAGIMAVPEAKTVDGFERQFGTNHLGHFLLFQLLRPALLAASTPAMPSRVVSVSSSVHRAGPVRLHDLAFEKEPYEPWLAYGQSKTANIYLSNEIERRYGAQGLHAIAIHPGLIQTNLATDAVLGEVDYTPDMLLQFKSVPQGAATSIVAALAKEWEGQGGVYLRNCAQDGPQKEGEFWGLSDVGFAPWAFDEAAAAELWEVSNKLVSFEE
ncbi:hypothetical protein F5X68DRAFT_210359 [Plectosphaerella plurivora]|uniref:Uncharacterized protein n=1 Tax=Plectosphaerella plurivora TaxID=936078 RepID=A0A9P9AAW8_9PEZI|nr:hypothetical protein F5X68DRAFT_210359 [Plectosphaerella plurivora]